MLIIPSGLEIFRSQDSNDSKNDMKEIKIKILDLSKK